MYGTKLGNNLRKTQKIRIIVTIYGSSDISSDKLCLKKEENR